MSLLDAIRGERHYRWRDNIIFKRGLIIYIALSCVLVLLLPLALKRWGAIAIAILFVYGAFGTNITIQKVSDPSAKAGGLKKPIS